MVKVGLTGGIGSGKSTIAKIFLVFGIPVFNADDAAKEIMHSDIELKKKVIEHFGAGSYSGETLNRKYIANIVFNNPYKLELLNSLIHPVTIAAAEIWMQQQTMPYAIKEAALMFESSAASHLDYVIGVYAPQSLRIKRVMERDNVSRTEVLTRMNRQIDEEIKMRLCDFVIINDEQQLVLPQVLKMHEQLINLSQAAKT